MFTYKLHLHPESDPDHEYARFLNALEAASLAPMDKSFLQEQAQIFLMQFSRPRESGSGVRMNMLRRLDGHNYRIVMKIGPKTFLEKFLNLFGE